MIGTEIPAGIGKIRAAHGKGFEHCPSISSQDKTKEGCIQQYQVGDKVKFVPTGDPEERDAQKATNPAQEGNRSGVIREGLLQRQTGNHSHSSQGDRKGNEVVKVRCGVNREIE